MIDLIIVIGYFVAIFAVAFAGRLKGEVSAEDYFLSSRNLRWYSIAVSTIATNIQGYQFLGMMGSAYLFGLAQANLEINAVQGILIAAFIFVPLYLKERVFTITQFIKIRLGETIGLIYTGANILLFSTITLGAALFWGAYAADQVFSEYLAVLHSNRLIRISILIVLLGLFSAIYTYFGGLKAVVKTDIIQFALLLLGGMVILYITIDHLGGWSELYTRTPELMHLHLPADHETLPWIHIFGLFLLNINYWCANQSVMQRSLAARSLKEAQIGLMVGGVMKYVMALVIVVPGIALFGILGPEQKLADPDMTFPYIVDNFLPTGLKGLILCTLFASLMSTVDSTFNSLATLWSVDIYKGYINKTASDFQMVESGRRMILVALISGTLTGLMLLYVKLENPTLAFTHTLNELRYYVNCGIVVLICSAGFFIVKNRTAAIWAFALTLPINLGLVFMFPDMNYFIRAFWVIVTGIFIVAMVPQNNLRPSRSWIQYNSSNVLYAGLALAISLILLHIIFH